MDYKTILYEAKEGIATVTLNRPDKLNAINYEMTQELIDACQKIDDAPDVRVMIMRGAGRSFCAGHDFAEMYGDPAAATHRYPEKMAEMINFEKRKYLASHRALREVKVPTICQVHGHCLVGGFYLANTCDLIVASEEARFANWTSRFGAVGTEELYEVFYMPIRKVKELLFTGQEIDAKEACRLGLVNRVVALDRLEDEARDLAKTIAALNPTSIQLLKQSLNRMMDVMGFSNAQATHFAWHELGHFRDYIRDPAGQRDKLMKAGVHELIRTIRQPDKTK